MALNNFRKVNITLNKANQRVLETQIAKVGDANGRELVVQITNNGIIEDQTGTTLKLNWQHENGKQGSTNFKVVDIKTGKFSVYYPKEMLFKGKVNASIEITSNGQITNSMNFKIIVQADVFDDGGGIVDGVFISLEEVNKKLDDREAEYVELKERQTTVENQFNDIQQEMTGKDIVSAPEIIASRSGFETLGDRLDNMYGVISDISINVKYPPSPFMPAKGDGLTDDTATLQAMIDYGQDNGVPVYLPHGTYLANLKLTGWGHRVYGASSGENPTELKPYDKTIPTITDGGVMLRHSDISHLKLSGEGAIGLELTRNSYLDSYNNIVVENFDIGVKISNSWGVNFDNLEVKNNVIGVQIDTEIAVNLINFTNSKISGNGIGLNFVKNIGHNIKLDSVSLEGNQTAIQIASYYGSLTIDNCYFETNNKHLIGLSNSASSFGVVQITNSWVYLDGDSQLDIQSQIQSFIFEGNEVLSSKPIDTILSLKQASIVKFDNNVVSQAGNLSNYITGVDNITNLDVNQQLRVGGTMLVPKKIFGNIETRDIKSASGQIQKFDPSGYTSSSSRLVDVTQVGEAAVDTGYMYASGTKLEKTSGRLEVKDISLIRGGGTIVNSTVNQRGQVTLHGGIQYVYTIDRPKNLTITERGYLIYDRDLNKLLTYVHSESTTGWKDAMGNDA